MLKIHHIVSKQMVSHPDGSLWVIDGFDNETPKIEYCNVYHWDAENGVNPNQEYFKVGFPDVVLQHGYGDTKPVMLPKALLNALIHEGFDIF